MFPFKLRSQPTVASFRLNTRSYINARAENENAPRLNKKPVHLKTRPNFIPRESKTREALFDLARRSKNTGEARDNTELALGLARSVAGALAHPSALMSLFFSLLRRVRKSRLPVDGHGKERERERAEGRAVEKQSDSLSRVS